MPVVVLLTACVSQGDGEKCGTVPLTEQTTTEGTTGCEVDFTDWCSGPFRVTCIGPECHCIGSGSASVFDDAAFCTATSLVQVETVNAQCGWAVIHL